MSIRLINCSLIDQDALEGDFALQIENGLITYVGSIRDSKSWPQAEGELSLDGRIVLPGLMDAHMHLENWALRHSQVSLDHVSSLKELLDLVRQQVLQQKQRGDTGSLILGGWNEEVYPERRPPTINEMDQVSKGIPLILTRICGHVCLVNSAVLKEFDWQKYAAEDPGSVGLDADGQPNGLLSENTMSALLSLQQDHSLEKKRELLRFGLKSMAAYGLTAVASQETNSLEDVDFLEVLADIYAENQDLPAYYAQMGLSHPDEINDFLVLRQKYKKHPLIRISSVKLFKDGSLGGRTALLRDPYSDDPTKTGLDLIPYQDLVEWFEKANEAGVQLTIHAIGDRAIAEIIAAFNAACRTKEDRSNPLRHAIIHCQITDRDLVQALAKTNLLVVTQPLFAQSDWSMAEARLGSERRNNAYDYRGIMDAGIHQAFSSDSPVESANPLLTLAAAMDHPQNEKALSLAEAMATSTAEVAYFLGQERSRGAIQSGAAADFTVLETNSANELTADQLPKTEIALTMRDGNIIYQKPEIFNQ